MRIIVISDTHGKFYALKNIIDRNKDANAFIFLGDGERELDDIKCYYQDKEILAVCGNCDRSSMLPDVGLAVKRSKRIIYLHGHSHNVRVSTDGIKKLARENSADIVLFGHTHVRHFEYDNGLYVLNPGSAAMPRDGLAPSYAYIDITDAGIVCNHVSL